LPRIDDDNINVTYSKVLKVKMENDKELNFKVDEKNQLVFMQTSE
jgi:hypothetical protein